VGQESRRDRSMRSRWSGKGILNLRDPGFDGSPGGEGKKI